jgi:hypothetical protein
MPVVVLLVALLINSPLAVLGQDYAIQLAQIDGAVGPDSIMANRTVTFRFRVINNSDHHFNMMTLFRIWSPDGAEWSYPERYTYIDSMPPIVCDIPPVCFDTSVDSIYIDPEFRRGFQFASSVVVYRSADGLESDTAGWSLAMWFNPFIGLPPWYDDDPLGIPIEVRLSDTGRTICVDSGSSPPILPWGWGNGIRVTPSWSGPHCFTITDRCCRGSTGNIDYDPDNLVDIGDVTALISYLYIPPNPVPFCFDEANVDGDNEGLIDIGDLTALISYLYIPPNPEPAPCP